jgi:hypothetical protein
MGCVFIAMLGYVIIVTWASWAEFGMGCAYIHECHELRNILPNTCHAL